MTSLFGQSEKVTDKQVGLLDYKLRQGESARMFLDIVPRNNERHPKIGADYRRLIIEEFARENFTRNQMSYLLQLLSEHKWRDAEKLFKQQSFNFLNKKE